MSLVPKVFVGGQLGIHTLRLEHNANLPPHVRRILSRIVSHDNRPTRGRDHQGRENPEESRLSAAIRAQHPEQLCGTHVERNPVQRRPVLIAMNQVLNGNYCRRGRMLNFRLSIGECRNFRNQGDLWTPLSVYDDTVSSIITMNKSGK